MPKRSWRRFPQLCVEPKPCLLQHLQQRKGTPRPVTAESAVTLSSGPKASNRFGHISANRCIRERPSELPSHQIAPIQRPDLVRKSHRERFLLPLSLVLSFALFPFGSGHSDCLKGFDSIAPPPRTFQLLSTDLTPDGFFLASCDQLGGRFQDTKKPRRMAGLKATLRSGDASARARTTPGKSRWSRPRPG